MAPDATCQRLVPVTHRKELLTVAQIEVIGTSATHPVRVCGLHIRGGSDEHRRGRTGVRASEEVAVHLGRGCVRPVGTNGRCESGQAT